MSKTQTKEGSPCGCVCPVSSSRFPIALKFGQVETASFSLGRIRILFYHDNLR